MRVCWERTRLGEVDHELLWLSVSLGGLLFAAVWLAAGFPWPHCVFLALTGYPCLTCGATRGALQFFHGNFLEALRWNPVVFAALCGITLFDLYAAAVLITGAPRLRLVEMTAGEGKKVRALILVALALNWAYLLAHSARYA